MKTLLLLLIIAITSTCVAIEPPMTVAATNTAGSSGRVPAAVADDVIEIIIHESPNVAKSAPKWKISSKGALVAAAAGAAVLGGIHLFRSKKSDNENKPTVAVDASSEKDLKNKKRARFRKI